jgi:hypothetical protein
MYKAFELAMWPMEEQILWVTWCQVTEGVNIRLTMLTNVVSQLTVNVNIFVLSITSEFS